MIPKRAFGFLLIFGVAVGLIVFYQTIGFSIADYFFGPYGPVVPITTHIVLFQFKDGTPPFTIKEVKKTNYRREYLHLLMLKPRSHQGSLG